jgi:hypothetical protein
MNAAKYEHHLLYFKRSVLAQYRTSSHLYSLKEDDMGGVLETISEDENTNGNLSDSPWVRVRFGFRRLDNSCVCVAALRYDVQKLPEEDLLIWRGNMLDHPSFAQNDPAFERWVNRYLEGSWDVEDGPRVQIASLVKLINALTRQTLGKPLFRFEENNLINYPAAENQDAYAMAHLELYRLLIDGLNKEALDIIAHRLSISLTDSSKTMNSLKEILPEKLTSVIHKPLKKCSDERNKKHGIPSEDLKSFQAFDTFHIDLMKIAVALEELNKWLEEKLSADSEACLKREDMTKLFPKFIGPPHPEFKLEELKKAKGKMIQSVEFGEVENPGIHQREEIVMHFTDGSSMAILVGSNALNLTDRFPDMKPEDMSTDLMIFWAPSIKIK